MKNIDTVFLDRDGVLNRKLPEGVWVRAWSQFEFLPGVPESLARLRGQGRRLILVSNQRGIAKGLLLETELRAVHARMQAELSARGAALDAAYFCPHDDGECHCRKPLPGLFLQAQRDYPAIRFERAAMCGDSVVDMLPAARLGCRTVLLAAPDKWASVRRRLEAEGLALSGTAVSLEEAVARFFSGAAGEV